MSKLFKQTPVRLADIGGGRYIRRAGESYRGFIGRLTSGDGDPCKTRSYAEAIGRGEALPPVIMVCQGEDFALVDGHHRCTAAASRCGDAISAVVFNVVSSAEADVVSLLAFEHSEAGIPWAESVRRISETLRFVRRAAQ